MTLDDIFSRLCGIDRDAQALIAEAGFDYEDGFGPESSLADPEQRFFREALEDLLYPFEDLHDGVRYLEAPTHGEHKLQRLPNGRYGYLDGQGSSHTFTCGSPLEALITDPHGTPRWVRTRLDHDGLDYFLWLHGSVPLDGLTIRERW